MTNPPDGSQSPRRGRPRRLQLDQVIEAALAVGLHQLTMGAVAERLGVAKAVLYGYVGSRAELVQLAGANASRRQHFPTDEGQPLAAWVLEYARALFEVLTMDGELLESWLAGRQSPVVEVDSAEMWLQALSRRGFAGDEALRLRRTVSHLVIGAAASMKHDRTLRAEGRPRPASARRAVLSRPADETALLREVVDVFAREVTQHNWEYGLTLLLQGVTTAREALMAMDGDAPHPGEEQSSPPA